MGMRLAAATMLAGGPGSGCTGPNCGRPKGKAGDIPPGKTTEDVYRDKTTGEWDKDREAWHQAYAESYITGKKPAEGRNPSALILGGGTASGKSTMARKLGADNPNAVHVDADSIKPDIPEFKQLKEQEGDQPIQTYARNPNLAATRVHEESSYLAKLAMAKAVANKLDIIYDATSSGKGGGTLAGIVAKLAAEGYDVHGLWADVPEEMATQRAAERADDPTDPAGFGRHIPQQAMHDTHVGAAANFLLMKNSPIFHQISLYDTSGNDKPKLIYSRGEGETKGHVYDSAKWEYYKAKARDL